MIQAVAKSSSSILSEDKMNEAKKWEDEDILLQIRQKIVAP